MSKTEVVRARIKPNLKKEVEKIFDTLGINSSQAINMFYNQVLIKRGLPFDISIPNDETKKVMEDTDKGLNLVHCSSVDDMFDKLKSDDDE